MVAMPPRECPASNVGESDPPEIPSAATRSFRAASAATLTAKIAGWEL